MNITRLKKDGDGIEVTGRCDIKEMFAIIQESSAVGVNRVEFDLGVAAEAPTGQSQKKPLVGRELARRQKKPRASSGPTKTPRVATGKLEVTPILLDILRAENRAMSVPELAAAFKTRTGIAANKQVGIALATLKNRFERVDKGVYRLAGSPAKGTTPPPTPRTLDREARKELLKTVHRQMGDNDQ